MLLPTRRLALAVLAAAGLPRLARGQDPAPPAEVPGPIPPMLPPPPASTPAAAPPAARPPAPTPQAAAPAVIDRSKRYYVLFDQNIDVASMRALRRQLTILVEAGVADITIVLHSAGGLVDPMLTTYSFIRGLPARIDTHAIGFVQSAATTLFLAGRERSADRTARFLFHPSAVPFNGTMTGPQMQDRQTQFAAVAAVTSEIYRDRTRLTAADIARFEHEEVIYTAVQAQAAGFVQTIADFSLPGPDKARILFLD